MFISLTLLSVSGVFADNPPKTAADLIAKHTEAWYAATHHPFLDQVKGGTLPFDIENFAWHFNTTAG